MAYLAPRLIIIITPLRCHRFNVQSQRKCCVTALLACHLLRLCIFALLGRQDRLWLITNIPQIVPLPTHWLKMGRKVNPAQCPFVDICLDRFHLIQAKGKRSCLCWRQHSDTNESNRRGNRTLLKVWKKYLTASFSRCLQVHQAFSEFLIEGIFLCFSKLE